MPAKELTSLNIGLDARYAQGGFPGIGRYVYSLATAMAELLSQEKGQPALNLIYNAAQTSTRFDLTTLAQNYSSVRLQNVQALPISSQEQWQLPLLARSQQIDLWHAPYYIRPYLMPLPTVLTAYDVTSARLPDSLPSRKARIIFELTTRLAFLTSRRIIAVSQAAAHDISQLYHVPASKIQVIPLGVEPQFKSATPFQIENFRATLNLPPSYILYVGINKPHKNLARLLDAFKQFRERTGSETVLILAGREDPRYSAALQVQTQQLGLSEGQELRFWGEVAEADLPKLYAAAEFLVMPSLYEGFGLPVLEAMACGCPVACANNSSLPEVAGHAALLFEATDTNQISEAITQLATRPELRAELRAKGVDRAAQFSWQHTAAQTLEVYSTAVSNKR